MSSVDSTSICTSRHNILSTTVAIYGHGTLCHNNGDLVISDTCTYTMSIENEDTDGDIVENRHQNIMNNNHYTTNNEPTSDDDDDDDDSDDASDRIGIMDGLSAEALAALLEFQLGGTNDDDDMNATNTDPQYLDTTTKFDKDTLCATYRPEDASRIAETLRRLHDRDHNLSHPIIDSNATNTDTNDHDDDSITATTTNEINIIPMFETKSPTSLSDDDHIRYLVKVLETDGVIRINHVLSSDLCHECSNYINQTLQEQGNTSVLTNDGTTPDNNNNNTILFGNVFARDHRYDMYLHPVREKMISKVLSILLHPNNSRLGQLFQMQLQQQQLRQQHATPSSSNNTQPPKEYEVVENNVSCRQNGNTSTFIDAEFHELSSLISDPGSISQPLHPDSRYYPVYAPLWTVFIALQNVTPEMGGTVVIPKTHTEEFHQLLSTSSSRQNIKALLRQSNTYQYSRADLNIGDCIVMDSRTFHYGGANHLSSNARRTLLYFTIRNPYHRSRGYPDCNSLYPDLDGTLKLSHFL